MKSQQRAESIQEENKTDDSINCKINIVRIDSLGREYQSDKDVFEQYILKKDKTKDADKFSVGAQLAYLKLISVPTMFDIGCTQQNPEKGFLTLCMLDSQTQKGVKQHFLQKTDIKKVSEIEKMRQQLMAVHTNMQVSEIYIKFVQPISIGNDYSLTIDGSNITSKKLQSVTKGTQLKIRDIHVQRLIKNDMEQVSIPIMTYLPLREGSLKNQSISLSK